MNTCTVEIGGKEFILCLDRDAVKKIESLGFDLNQFASKPVTYIDLLWYGGFLHNYDKEINRKLAEKYEQTYIDEGGDVGEVIEFLIGEYGNFINAQSDTKKEHKKAKISKAKK